MAEEQSGFLGRWARRKNDVLQGKVVEEPVVQPKPVLPEAVENPHQGVAENAIEEPQAMSLDDVKLLTKDSDFKPFMAQNVGADVRNAAMKKLFADPHYNIMDGLDIYIDDYSKPDPIPEAMLRAMTSSKFLKLFDVEEDKDKDKEKEKEKEKEKIADKPEDSTPRDNGDNREDQTVSQSNDDSNRVEPPCTPQINSSPPELLKDSVASLKDHDHSHLRLQPDHAASAPKAGHGT